jgi:hypothetical protein
MSVGMPRGSAAGPSVLVRQWPVIGDNGSSHLACRLPETSQDQLIPVHPQRTHRCLGQRRGARDAVCDASDVHESLSKSKLGPAQVHACRDAPSIARDQEHHRVVPRDVRGGAWLCAATRPRMACDAHGNGHRYGCGVWPKASFGTRLSFLRDFPVDDGWTLHPARARASKDVDYARRLACKGLTTGQWNHRRSNKRSRSRPRPHPATQQDGGCSHALCLWCGGRCASSRGSWAGRRHAYGLPVRCLLSHRRCGRIRHAMLYGLRP